MRQTLVRGQKEIVEFVILSAASLALLVAVAFIFSFVSATMMDAQLKNGAAILAEEVATAITMVYETVGEGKSFNGTEQPVLRITLDLPTTLGGREYTVFYSNNTVIALVAGFRADSPVPLAEGSSITTTGTVFSSTQKAAVSYYSDQNLIKLEMV